MKRVYFKTGRRLLAGILCGTLTLTLLGGIAVFRTQADGEELTARDRLEQTLEYCQSMDEAKYTAASWKQFQRVLEDVQSVYEDESSEETEYKDAFDTLESAKAALCFTASEETGNPLPMRDLTVDEIVYEMGTGWNLGNTMDGHTGFTPNETIWQDVVTTKSTIEAIHDMGFNTIRIPITWGTMIDDENGYAINEQWMSRVQDIVDYAVSLDMYVIINIHHDGAEQSGWLRVASDDIDAVYDKFEGVWRNIAETFKDYDEHLIFESMNEITGGDDSAEGILRDTKVIMNLNQIFVNVVRSTGSNNADRWLSVPARYTNIDKTTNAAYGFDIPNDTTASNRLFVAVHYYDYNFGMVESMSSTSFSSGAAISLETELLLLQERFTSQGIPVIMGEYGCINKNNTEERAYHVEVVNALCRRMGIVPVYWDQGWFDTEMDPDYSFALIDREDGSSIYPEITDAIMRGMYLDTSDLTEISKSPEVTELESISFDAAQSPDRILTLKLGDCTLLRYSVAPADSNDVVLWKSDNDSIATVSRGIVRARGIGETTITAYSQSGSVLQELTVLVQHSDYEVPCTGIETEESEYEITVGETLTLNAAALPENTDCTLRYSSADETVATVNAFGKVVGVSEGTAYIIITASNGITTYVRVKVTQETAVHELNLALNVYYNDSERSYWNNEYGEPICITEDGQYTLSFDCAADLSAAAAEAGVTQLANLTAIYIKDYDVTVGNASSSKLESCDITYDSISVNGQTLTITQSGPKSAIKASGILDTNDPINSWDGSAVAEVNSVSQVANFTGIENPTQISVTFTISNLVFENEGDSPEEGEGEPEVTLSSVTPASFSMVLGETTTITVLAEAAETEIPVGTKVTFVAKDEAIVFVDSTSVALDESGKASCEVRAAYAGTTMIQALLPDGTLTSFTVKVTENKVEEETGKASEQTEPEETLTEPEENQNRMEIVMLAMLLGCILVFVLGGTVFIIRSSKKR